MEGKAKIVPIYYTSIRKDHDDEQPASSCMADNPGEMVWNYSRKVLHCQNAWLITPVKWSGTILEKF